jgi:hypothetical protein
MSSAWWGDQMSASTLSEIIAIALRLSLLFDKEHEVRA